MTHKQKLKVQEDGVNFTVEYYFGYEGEPQWHASYKNVLTGQVDKVSMGVVQEKKPELYEKIMKTLGPLKEAYLEAEKKAKEEAKAKRRKKLDKFATEVQKLLPEGYTAIYTYCRIEKDKVSAYIKYDGSVSEPGRSFYSHSTNVPWVAVFDYKRRRYKTLKKAVASAVERMGEKISQNESKTKQENKMAKLAEEISVVDKRTSSGGTLPFYLWKRKWS